MGYTATTLVRPPSDQIGPDLSVHVHGVPLAGAKSRVETLIRMRLELVRPKPPSDHPASDSHLDEEPAPRLDPTSDEALALARARFGPAELWQRIGTFTHLKMPPGTQYSGRRSRKYAPPAVDPKQLLYLDATVVRATPPHDRVYVCDSCMQRERKRKRFKPKGKTNRQEGDSNTVTDMDPEELPTEEEMRALGIDPSLSDARERALQQRYHQDKARIVIFNTDDYVEFRNGEAILPARLTCYSRHHKEKNGFCIIYTLRNWTGQIVASGTTPAIMITDDRKPTKRSIQLQTGVQAHTQAVSQAQDQAQTQPRTQAPSHDPIQPQAQVQEHPYTLPQAHTPVQATTEASSQTETQAWTDTGASTVPIPLLEHASTSSVQGSDPPPSLANFPNVMTPSNSVNPLNLEMDSQHCKQTSTVGRTAQHRRRRSSVARNSPYPRPRNNSSSTIHPPSGPSISSPPEESPSSLSLINTVPTGPISPSAYLTGLAPDTLQPLPEEDTNMSYLPPGLPANADLDSWMQAYLFSHSQPAEADDTTEVSTPRGSGAEGDPNVPHPFFTEPLSASLTSSVALPAPKVTQLIPHEGPTTGGTEVTVLGENFPPGVTVLFGAIPAPTTKVWGSNTLVCTLPPSTIPGPVLIALRDSAGTVITPSSSETSTGAGTDAASGPPVFFTYFEQSDRDLMELALQVVGLKMTGQVHSARDVAMRVMGND